jgi:probable phosphoglycerate mutase
VLTARQSTVGSVEIVLVRHGQPEWVRDGLNVVDPPLTELGHRQAALMADLLSGDQFDEVLVSPLVRARQTAAPLLERLGRDEQIDPWLEEIRDPGWHGTPAEKAEQAYREMRERPVTARWDGLLDGEPIRDFVERIRLGASLFLAERGIHRVEHDLPIWTISEPDKRIALVAHAGTNSVFMCHLLGLQPTPWEWDRFVLGHASVSRIEALEVHGGYTFSLTSLSNHEHIPASDRTR